MRSRARLAVSPTSEASSKRQGDGQRFQKKAMKTTNQNEASAPANVRPLGIKNQQDGKTKGICPALREPPLVHRNIFELFADAVAEAIRSGRGCRQVGLARCLSSAEAESGQCALGFGLPLESAARCLAASVRQFQPIRHPSHRSARQVSLLFSRRPSTRLKSQLFILALALSVKLSVKASANSQKFSRFNPNSL